MPSKKRLLRESLLRSLEPEPLLVSPERILLGSPNKELVASLESNLVPVLQVPGVLTEADRRLLETAQPGLVEQVQRAVRAHLLSPPAIPRQDLPFYVPWLEEDGQIVSSGLPEHLPQAQPTSDDPVIVREMTGDGNGAELENRRILARLLAAWADLRRRAPDGTEDSGPATLPAEGSVQELAAATEAPATWKGFRGLGPLPFLTAALETLGEDPEAFGFLLRYGIYAPEERRSQIRVGGMGLAEFSERLTAWIEKHGTSKFPIQVVDDGSGELTIHLLE